MWIQVRNHGIFLQHVISVENYYFFFCIWKEIHACFLVSASKTCIFNSLPVLKWICNCIVCPCVYKAQLTYFPFGSAPRLSHHMWFGKTWWTHASWLPWLHQTIPTLTMLTAGHYQIHTGLTAFWWLMLTKEKKIQFFYIISIYSHPHIVNEISNQWLRYYTLDWKKHGRNTQFCKMYPSADTV